ncbi:IS630 transposase-related protein [Xiamenia xianingshaonis]|uniref:IS630 transposase-related protein n=1 Tax=Xiamenia xianingshaonis TaxID=2682776 RepID=UPI001408F525
MAYSKDLVQDVLDYLDAGHSTREAEERFNVSHESAARWRRLRDGNLRNNRPHPIRYPPETARMALGLAYGDHGFTLDQVAVMVGVSAPTISVYLHMEEEAHGGRNHGDPPRSILTRSRR